MTDIGTLRETGAAPQVVMTRRGWVLVVLGFLVPGLAQVVAGNRSLGRLGLLSTLVTWALIIGAGLLFMLNRAFAVTLFTNVWLLLVAQAVIVYWIVLFTILTVDTLRLARIVRLAPRSRVLLPLAMVLVFTLVGGGAAYAFVQLGALRGLVGTVFVASETLPPVDGRYNILLLGADAGEGREGLRPDSISVVSIDAETGATVIVGIPRNLENAPFPEDSPMHEVFPDGLTHLTSVDGEPYFNAIYTEAMNVDQALYPAAEANGSDAGIEATKDAAEGVTGLVIQYFALIDMEGFHSLIDALGGVTVDVAEPLHLLTGNCQGEMQDFGWIETGVQKMDGATALLYARARCTTSDYDRMLRQRQVQLAIAAQFDPMTVATKFEAIAEAGGNIVETDIPQTAIGTFADLGVLARDNMHTLELTPENGVVTADPDFDQIRAMVHEAIVAAGQATSTNGETD